MEFKYSFDHKYRGRAVIIGNNFERQNGSERKGCKKDLKMMKELFTRLDFKVMIYENLKAKDMENKLRRLAGKPKDDKNEKTPNTDDESRDKGSGKKTASEEDEKRDKELKQYDEENRNSDCFVLVISTHGTELSVEKDKGLPPETEVWKHAVLGEDGVPLYVEKIINIFTDENAPGLAGKPKLFFLQACRSRGSSARLVRISNPKYDHGYEFSIKTVKKKGKVANLFNIVKEKLQPKRKHLMYSEVDIKHKVDQLYTGWLADTEDTTDDISEVDCEHDSTEESSDGDIDTEDMGNSSSSEDEGSIDGDQEDGLREDDEEDARKGRESGYPPLSLVQKLLPTPFDVVPIFCPDDFLIMYPVMSGKSAMRSPKGSYLLRYLHNGRNASKLVKGNNLLQYLTYVSQDMASYEFLPGLKMKSLPKYKRREKLKSWMDSSIKHLSKNKALLATVLSEQHRKCIDMDEILREEYLKTNVNDFTNKELRRIIRRLLPFKMSACVVHRLKDNVFFSPKSPNSPMAKVKDALTKQEKNES